MERNSLQIIVHLKGFSGAGQPCLHTTITKNIKHGKRSRTPNVSFPSREAFSPQRQQAWVLNYKPVHSRQVGISRAFSFVSWVLLKPVGKPPWVFSGAETELGQQENKFENLSWDTSAALFHLSSGSASGTRTAIHWSRRTMDMGSLQVVPLCLGSALTFNKSF